MSLPPLPVDAVLPALLAALRAQGAVVLVAPPGAGKSTRVPPAILDAGLAGDGSVLMLQPRRVAARMVARRMAAERGQAVGDDVGWHIRFDRRVGPTTRIEVITEGLLTRRLQADPLLEGVGCVVLDELHERSQHADLALALLAEIRREVRPDLRIVAMSATLDPGPVAAFLDAATIEAAGRAYPVEISYESRVDDRPLPARCAAGIRRALRETAAGHVLAFLPGVGEIERTADALGAIEGVEVLPLHGRLPPEAQDRALAAGGPRRVVLATNVAETSVTLEGVAAVVDTGLARQPVFDAAAGLTRLLRQPISRAAADQRAGRAGRTGPGRCYRLWTPGEQTARPAAEVPELLRADLTRVALEIRGWGADPATFGWLSPPPAASWAQAEDTLRLLGAWDGGLTPVGRALLALPIEPRVARVVLAGHAGGRLAEAAAAAALVTERDVLREVPDITGDSDLDLRLDALARGGGGAVHDARRIRDQLVQLARASLGPEGRGRATLLDCLLAGFPDRVAWRRAPRSERLKLASGSGAVLDARSIVRDAPWLLALSLEGGARGTEHRVRLAIALDPADLPTTPHRETRFDPTREAVVEVRQDRYLALVVRETVHGADPALAAEVLAEAAASDPPRAFGLGPDEERYLARVRWLAARRPEVPALAELSPGAASTPLLVTLCAGCRSFSDLRRLPLLATLRGLLGRDVTQALDRHAPASLALPDGSAARVEYGDPAEPPVVAGRIQQFFGLAATPLIGGEPVRLHLLAPNNRPAQITQDLASFWAQGYPAVRKDLRGRYPKHPWPDDPLAATPTGRAKPRGT
ncbi:MAG: ATP-dependent helicase HrpB [Myxococcales bacterium]|nr:ATP-dependent helicase HrpB [Myxococcales bacterium]